MYGGGSIWKSVPLLNSGSKTPNSDRVGSSRSGKTAGTLLLELHCFDVLTQVLSMTLHD